MRDRINVTFRSLGSKNFRLFLFGQGVSVIGTWMQRVALNWLIYKLTSSAILLGLVNFASYIPLLIVAPLAGVWLDRVSKLKVIIVTQTLAMLQALFLAFLVLSGKIEIWHIILLSFVLGIVNAFDVPGRQSFYINLVDKKEDLPNAVALNSAAFHLSRFIGPSLAGIIIASWSEGICFLVNGLSYVAVIWALFRIKTNEVIKDNILEKNLFGELGEGFRYLSSKPLIKNILTLVALISLFGWSYTVLLPIFAKDILHGDALTFGLLNSATAVGAIIGAFYAASRKNLEGLIRISIFFTIIFGVSVILFSFSNILWFSIITIAGAGLGAMLHNTSANSFIQSAVSEEKRGRVLGIYAFAHQGLIPLGSLYLGWAASSFGAPVSMLTAGLFCLLAVMVLGPKIIAQDR